MTWSMAGRQFKELAGGRRGLLLVSRFFLCLELQQGGTKMTKTWSNVPCREEEVKPRIVPDAPGCIWAGDMRTHEGVCFNCCSPSHLSWEAPPLHAKRWSFVLTFKSRAESVPRGWVMRTWIDPKEGLQQAEKIVACPARTEEYRVRRMLLLGEMAWLSWLRAEDLLVME